LNKYIKELAKIKCAKQKNIFFFKFYTMGWTTGVRFPAGVGIFFFLHHHIQAGSGAPQPPIHSRGSFTGIKRPGYEANNSHPYIIDVKNTWSYTSIPPYVFMAWCLIKQRIHLHGMVLKLYLTLLWSDTS